MACLCLTLASTFGPFQVGDTKIIRKKVITRQKVRHQQVVTATITTHHPVIDSPDPDFLHLLSSPMLEELKLADGPWKKRTPNDDKEPDTIPATMKFPETTVSYESLPPAPPPPLPPRALRPVSDYDNEKQTTASSASLPQQKDTKLTSTTKIVTNKQRQQSLMQQSASLQSFSRQTLFNGKLIKTETGEKFDASAMKASKSETFDEHGHVTERRGAGSYAECSYAKGDRILSPPSQVACCNDHQVDGPCTCGIDDDRLVLPGPKGLPPQPPPRPPKRSGKWNG